MRIEKEGCRLLAFWEGRADTLHAEEILETVEKELTEEISELEIDMSGTEYISSAGLRILLILMREMKNRKGMMWVTHVSEPVMDVFCITGFADILAFAEEGVEKNEFVV